MVTQNSLIDIGANLTDACFRHDFVEMLQRAKAAGVVAMVVTGCHLAGSQAALALARQNPKVLFATAGVHPHHARQCNDRTINNLRTMAREKTIVAIGECGLDYNRNFSPPAEQECWFEAQVALACELRMPLFVHEREAHDRLVAILQKYQQQLPPTVIHCFTGNGKELDAYLAMGWFIGITGWICDERRGRHLQELVARIPLDRLMLETDAPYLTPRHVQPQPLPRRNEPAFLVHVLDTVARAMGKNTTEVAQATTRTARQFFRLGE